MSARPSTPTVDRPAPRAPAGGSPWPQRLTLLVALASAALLGAAAATAFAPAPPSPPAEPHPALAHALLQVSDGLTALPFRVLALHDGGQLSTPQAVDALQRAAERARTGWHDLARQIDGEPSPERIRLAAQLGPQVQMQSLLLERLADSLREQDSALTQRLLTHQLAPASRDLMPTLRLLTSDHTAPRPDTAATDEPGWLRCSALPAAGGLTVALTLLLRRRRGRGAAPPPPPWRHALDGVELDQGLARLLRQLVNDGLADLACEARLHPGADPGGLARLVVRHVATAAGLPPPPAPGDLLLLPGRSLLLEQLRDQGLLTLGGHLADLGTTLAWPGYASCCRALLLPLWQGPTLHGCLAVLLRSTAPLDAAHIERLRAAADLVSVRLGRQRTAATEALA
ncbi:MAG: hypothetical protein DI603_13590 [Roseateles depolymerans]|uniref:Uncharacterized protein n=1 Tax=Roseateles depolymerans TaxID=76731 RepID=A0A2W5FJ41_9BURK|nr:MAG: hypothetical protein DI603_13590 [Roseateles depolymerans]